MFLQSGDHLSALRRASVALFWLPALACTDDAPVDDGTDSVVGTDGVADGDGDGDTADGDSTTGDGDGDSTGDGDGDTTDDGDTTGDGDTGGSGCGPYPGGPYQWYDNGVVSPDTTLPAKYGPDGMETTLTMSDVHDNCEEVKSLIFAFGAND